MLKGMHKSASTVLIAVMGATGTGKSTFIRLLTNDNTIRVGHNEESETVGIQTADYIDQETGYPIALVDTPGFDNSREDITDVDILRQIVDYLEPESGESRKLNGIIYMHRISDPRIGGVSRRHLKMFQAICGVRNLANVRIVTTHWDRVTKEEGTLREAERMHNDFKCLIEAGAQMHRHVDTVESARHIMSELIPLPKITTAIQEEIRDGKALAETGAGRVLIAVIQELRRRLEEEMAKLKEEMEKAAKTNNLALRAEFELQRRAREEKIKRGEVDLAKLEKTLKKLHGAKEPARLMNQWPDERRKLLAEVTAARERATRLENEAAKRQKELEQQIVDANRKAELVELQSAAERAEHVREAEQWANERSKMSAELTVARENATRLANDASALSGVVYPSVWDSKPASPATLMWAYLKR